jgi:hypothetical protein
MAVRPKMLVCSHSIVEIAGSNSEEIMNIRLVFVVGIGELITRSEESYRLCVFVCVCVYVCVCVCVTKSV